MDKKKNRQYQLHQQLKQNHYSVAIADLCEQLDVSDKTLYQDVQEFRDLYHAPILLENGYLSYDKNNNDVFELPGTCFAAVTGAVLDRSSLPHRQLRKHQYYPLIQYKQN